MIMEKTPLNKLVDILTESKHKEGHPEFNYALDLAIAEARGLMEEEKEQIKEAYIAGADNVVDHTTSGLNQELVSAIDYFNSK